MDRKAELKLAYKNRPVKAGVFQIKNKVNGKLLLGSSLNLDGPLNRYKFELRLGSHRNKKLQEEWQQYGEENFDFEILEVIKIKDDPHFDLKDELTLLEEIWLEKLQPFGEKGYNNDNKIRL